MHSNPIIDVSVVFTISDDEDIAFPIWIPGTISPSIKPSTVSPFLNITLQPVKVPPVIEQLIVLSVLMAMYKGPVGVTAATTVIIIKNNNNNNNKNNNINNKNNNNNINNNNNNIN